MSEGGCGCVCMGALVRAVRSACLVCLRVLGVPALCSVVSSLCTMCVVCVCSVANLCTSRAARGASSVHHKGRSINASGGAAACAWPCSTAGGLLIMVAEIKLNAKFLCAWPCATAGGLLIMVADIKLNTMQSFCVPGLAPQQVGCC